MGSTFYYQTMCEVAHIPNGLYPLNGTRVSLPLLMGCTMGVFKLNRLAIGLCLSLPLTALGDAPSECPESQPNALGKTFRVERKETWFGDDALSVSFGYRPWKAAVTEDGSVWLKVFWISKGYNARSDPYPKFDVLARPFFTGAPGSERSVLHGTATNVLGRHQDSILTVVELPNPGCWSFIGKYQGAELEFVAEVFWDVEG